MKPTAKTIHRNQPKPASTRVYCLDVLRKTLLCVFLLARQSDAVLTSTAGRTTLTKMMARDVDGGSSIGYMYNQQQGLPVYYVRYTNHGSGRYYHAPAVQYVATPVARAVPATTFLHPYVTTLDVPRPSHQGTANYRNEQLEQPAAPLVNSLPRVSHSHVDGKITMADEGSEKEGTREWQKSVEEDRDNEESEKDEGEVSDRGDGVEDEEIHGGSHGDSTETFEHGNGREGVDESPRGDDRLTEEGAGEKNANEEYSENETEREKGYKKGRESSETKTGSDDSEHKEGYYENKDEHAEGHVAEVENHGSHDKAEKFKDGGSYGHKSYYKKGYKTNGYHNVFHKDEYKKETEFYDDDHKKGHFEEYEELDEGYKSDEGDFKKGGRHSSGHDYQDRGKKGRYDKGRRDNQDQGHRAEKGEESYYSSHEDHSAEEDSKSERTHKFRKGDC
ncbi:unnamed protein product [Heterotrigona itama]|uniref:Uncharacterized protein n=1 Tax=Heterotrigona itama TaxID=395501 RepID=A0A6V7HAB3_9HYME|nr:unnamed protein product [Heterotrigona itama]